MSWVDSDSPTFDLFIQKLAKFHFMTGFYDSVCIFYIAEIIRPYYIFYLIVLSQLYQPINLQNLFFSMKKMYKNKKLKQN